MSHQVTCHIWLTSSVRVFSSSVIGTDPCYGLFEREKKTVQAKNIKFCVGGLSCVGGGKNHLHQYNVQKHIHQKIALQRQPATIFFYLIELVELIPNISLKVFQSVHVRHQWRKMLTIILRFWSPVTLVSTFRQHYAYIWNSNQFEIDKFYQMNMNFGTVDGSRE